MYAHLISVLICRNAHNQLLCITTVNFDQIVLKATSHAPTCGNPLSQNDLALTTFEKRSIQNGYFDQELSHVTTDI